MPHNDPSEESIFALALERPSPAERAAFVQGACVGNPSLLARVEGLLRSHEGAGSFLQQPLDSSTLTSRRDRPSEGPGTRIGPYKLLQQIGEGGMGVVYMAEQEQPVRRKVALKIIKPGMDSQQVVARFEAERQALAVMDHTNIAKVFDAGDNRIRPAVFRDGARARRPDHRSTATTTSSRPASAWNSSSPSARRSSTHIRKASSTETSSRRTCW